ncbi:hypothetical protein [Mesorhizobium sp.]|uniref:hypothetical protein n=1 Tax=Mesorhizobium sp. TaxID=1871066 RepID=UPI000FE2A1CF|nr:hypothetical protein [Mesorhizobium sp.]RWN99375.1 MAG: hypothetical protein EOS06_18465 [Mesorhizobium sp.]
METDEQVYYRELGAMKKSDLLDEIRSLHERLDVWQSEHDARKKESAAGSKAAIALSEAHAGRWLIALLAFGAAYFVAYMYSPGLMRLLGVAPVIYAFYRAQEG